ncbi:hypothetical protein [Kitasatospora herbaricolor]|uniref:Gametolysin peptidase M11 n=1 Tax=Kitasatospora herbaricolor TaxID=68217 RepID=A0ABZ1WH40_9ACTN|nr:hypothetical protein [Kitasatospora herbaricolor]
MTPVPSTTHAAAAPSAGPARRPRRTPRGAAPLLAVAGALTLSATTVLTPATAAEPAPSRVDRHAVVLVNFRNLALADAQRAHDQAVRNFFGPADSLATYYKENSGGRMSVVPAKGDGVFGPFTLDMDDSAACETGKIAELARKTIPDLDYDHVSIVLNSKYCGAWWGLASVPGPVSWFHEGAVADKAAIVHEFGHNLGFAHQKRQTCTAGSFTACTDDGYSNRTPMGGGGEKKGLTAPELLSLKWLTTQQVTTPTATGSVHLAPLHAAGTSGVRAIDLPLGTGGDRIVIEYRTPDSATPDLDVAQGVNVYRIPQGRYNQAVLISNVGHDSKAVVGSFVAGAPISDSSAKLSVDVSQATAAGAEVKVLLGSGPGTATTAAPSPVPTGPAPARSTNPAVDAAVLSTPEADDHAVIGSTVAPEPAASAGKAGDGSLAATGAAATGPAVIGGVLVVTGATVTVLLTRRRSRRRAH